MRGAVEPELWMCQEVLYFPPCLLHQSQWPIWSGKISKWQLRRPPSKLKSCSTNLAEWKTFSLVCLQHCLSLPAHAPSVQPGRGSCLCICEALQAIFVPKFCALVVCCLCGSTQGDIWGCPSPHTACPVRQRPFPARLWSSSLQEARASKAKVQAGRFHVLLIFGLAWATFLVSQGHCFVRGLGIRVKVRQRPCRRCPWWAPAGLGGSGLALPHHRSSGLRCFSVISVGSPKPPVFLVLFFFPPVLSVTVRKAGAHKPGTREARCQLPTSGGRPRPAALWWLRADVWQKCSASRRPSEAENLSEDRINSPRLSYSRVCAKSFEYVKWSFSFPENLSVRKVVSQSHHHAWANCFKIIRQQNQMRLQRSLAALQACGI